MKNITSLGPPMCPGTILSPLSPSSIEQPINPFHMLFQTIMALHILGFLARNILSHFICQIPNSSLLLLYHPMHSLSVYIFSLPTELRDLGRSVLCLSQPAQYSQHITLSFNKYLLIIYVYVRRQSVNSLRKMTV